MKSVEVTAKNNLQTEQEVVGVVKSILETYQVPLFTHTIQVEENTRPHSHPILTLNTQTKDLLDILQTLVHEQFHWFAPFFIKGERDRSHGPSRFPPWGMKIMPFVMVLGSRGS